MSCAMLIAIAAQEPITVADPTATSDLGGGEFPARTRRTATTCTPPKAANAGHVNESRSSAIAIRERFS